MKSEDLKDFVKLSKYAGCRFDIVQAGGGNTSVKLEDGTMLVKASGVYLSEVCKNYGYAKVNNSEVLNIFSQNFDDDKRTNDKIASEIVMNANIDKTFRPSIETLLHSMLNKFVLHSHPIVVNAITCRKNWRKISTEMFKDEKISLIDYKTPGLELALELKKNYNGSKIVFLQNHGLIVSAQTCEEVIDLTEQVLSKIENFLNVDMSRYKTTTEIYNMFIKLGWEEKIPYLSEDKTLDEIKDSNYLCSKPFCPDKMVYCGYKTCEVSTIDDLKRYRGKYFEVSKVLFYKNKLFFVANNIKKAKEIEDVFKFHLLSLNLYANADINYLTESEISYIGNWEAEKYRQNL